MVEKPSQILPLKYNELHTLTQSYQKCYGKCHGKMPDNLNVLTYFFLYQVPFIQYFLHFHFDYIISYGQKLQQVSGITLTVTLMFVFADSPGDYCYFMFMWSLKATEISVKTSQINFEVLGYLHTQAQTIMVVWTAHRLQVADKFSHFPNAYIPLAGSFCPSVSVSLLSLHSQTTKLGDDKVTSKALLL